MRVIVPFHDDVMTVVVGSVNDSRCSVAASVPMFRIVASRQSPPSHCVVMDIRAVSDAAAGVATTVGCSVGTVGVGVGVGVDGCGVGVAVGLGVGDPVAGSGVGVAVGAGPDQLAATEVGARPATQRPVSEYVLPGPTVAQAGGATDTARPDRVNWPFHEDVIVVSSARSKVSRDSVMRPVPPLCIASRPHQPVGHCESVTTCPIT